MSTGQPCELHRILQEQLRILGATLKPSTVGYYRAQANGFLRYLHRDYPEIHSPGQLQRNPHILGWLRSLAEDPPPLTNRSRRAALICMRRLFDDLADNGYPVREALILSQDLPPHDLYLPIPLSPEVDHLLDRELRQTDDLLSNALLLIRATGMRIGECLRLNRDSLRHLGGNQWALHVPLGKLHNERWVPLDDEACKIFHRILSLSRLPPIEAPNPPSPPLLLLPNGKKVSYHHMTNALKDAAKRARCTPARLHQLRHTYATVMLRAGISLTALKEILGHRDIRMTMCYVQITQNDLQREYHLARRNMASVHAVPQLSTATDLQSHDTGIPAICHALDTVKHQLEMHRRQLATQQAKNKIQSLARRLARLRAAMARLQNT
ncbi:MAG: tyrosine-type recombinase/integrase [Syntrophobacteraceae bacterium]|nr:tyrosine-type recombinase/integrase [Syntrophobacteraceae bacterium]